MNNKSKICCVDGCNNKIDSNGYCVKHYTQLRIHGKLLKRTKFDPNEIVIYDDYAEIILYDKNCEEVARALIDIDDVEKCKKYKWHLKEGKYVTCSSTKKYLHHYIMNIEDLKGTGFEVDHKDRNKLNNRKYNLRVTTININRANINAKQDNQCGVKGVYFFERVNKWRAQIVVDKKNIHLGYFDKIEDATKTRKEAEIKYYGEGVI